MAETSFPFDSGAGANPGEDGWTRMARWFGDDGVAPSGNMLAVTADGSGRQVFVADGAAIIRGHYYMSDASKTIAIAANASGQTRVDRIVLRLDPTANAVTTVVRQGTPGSGPPALNRTDVGLYEISLAQVTVANGATNIAAGDVSGERTILGPAVQRASTLAAFLFPQVGQVVHDSGRGRWFAWNGSTWCELLHRNGTQVILGDLAGGGNFTIEIGPTSGSPGSTALELHSKGASPNDYDGRIAVSGGTAGQNGSGDMDLTAANLRHNGSKVLAGDTVVTSSTGFTAAAGWSIGSVRYHKLGPLVVLDVALTRTGAALPASSTGNLQAGDVTVLSAIPTAIRPAGAKYFGYANQLQADGIGRVQADGTVDICTLSPTAAIGTGESVTFTAVYDAA